MAGIRKRVATRSLVTLVMVATVTGLFAVPTLAATRGSAPLDAAKASVTPAAALTLCSPPSCYNVLNYGASPNGVADNSAAFKNAIAAAQQNPGGGTVYVPAGTYAFTSLLNSGYSIKIPPPTIVGTTVTLEGAGQNTSILVEHVGGQQLLGVEADGSTVEGLTLNARSYGGGADVTVAANNTTISQDNILGAHKTGVIGQGSHAPFALYFQGLPGASQRHPLDHMGNTVSNTNIEDGVNNDGFSFSFQDDGVISNVVHFGSRLALYVDKNVKVTNYTYIPNPECLLSVNGFYIAGNSQNITIDGFTTYGSGGVVDGPAETNIVSNVTIDNERFMGHGFHLDIGATTGLVIENSSFNTDNGLLINPDRRASSFIVANSTNIGFAEIEPYLGSTYPTLGMTFTNDTFSTPNPIRSTFLTTLPKAPGTTTVTINGGTWSNNPFPPPGAPVGGGFYNIPGATNVTYNVTGLDPIPVAPPTISGTAMVGNTLTATSRNGNWLTGQTPAPTISGYQWYRNGALITGATSSTYVPTVADSYSVAVTAMNPTGSTTVMSAAIPVTG